ncbi:hypothetical protein [Flavobacterium aquatile]|nr:hypothetical protein [Flavobacterium aquatile]
MTFINLFTGEISSYPKRGKYKNLDVSITLINAYINGSLHKFRNLILFDEDQNYNDFSFCQVKEVISYLTKKLKIENSTSLTNLEFGINIDVSKNPQDIIDYNLMMYRNKHHYRDDKFGGKGDFKEFRTTDFYIKIYNKSKQYHLKKHRLRIELKIIKKRYIQNLGIFKLEDLNEIEVIYRLYERLLKEFNELTIVDEFYLLNLPKEDKANLVKFTNPNYWKHLKKEESLKVFNRVKRDFNLLVEKHNLNKTKKEILENLESKFQELLNDCDENLLLLNIA